MCEAWEVYPILRPLSSARTEKKSPGFFRKPEDSGDRGTAGSGGGGSALQVVGEAA